MTGQPHPPDGTRLQLIRAGAHLFGRQGYAAASTRAIAALAGTNIASIAYHFGGKEGLREACAAEFARRVRAVLPGDGPAPALDPDAAADELRAILGKVAAYLLSGNENGDLVAFMLREMADASPALAVVYDGLAEPMHRRLCALWAAAAGHEAESPATRLKVFSLIGQVIYFRIGAPIVARRMGWPSVGPAEAGAIIDVLMANLDAVLDAARKGV
ncbi:MAG: CerR family C-terminal domain-containing protein [Proteobacteria bacterium]|nr:CerR family C-terminal domain-containing protein [Pseudomonadota bacterium]MBS0573024.1 CerR family C-terminal domain-containing protein [Pseudomonadota bacterium]